MLPALSAADECSSEEDKPPEADDSDDDSDDADDAKALSSESEAEAVTDDDDDENDDMPINVGGKTSWTRFHWSHDRRRHDPREKEGFPSAVHITPGAMIDPRAKNYTRLEVFEAFFPGEGAGDNPDPKDFRVQMLAKTTAAGKRKYGDGFSAVRWGEMLCFFGLVLMMQCTTVPSRDRYFTAPKDPWDFSPNFTPRMSETRFTRIALVIDWACDPDEPAGSPFARINGFISAINTKCLQVYKAGSHLILDESMSQWFQSKCPGWRGVARKPVRFGHELWTMADTCRIMIRIELSHGAKYVAKEFADSAKKYVGDKFMNFGKLQPHTCVVLRMCEPWAGSGRVVIADAGFGSVMTALALYILFGLYFIGNVKGASSMFPKDYAKKKLPVRENRVYMTTKYFKTGGGSLCLLHAVPTWIRSQCS